MKKIRVKKIYQGCVDVRLPVAEKCHEEGVGMEIHHNGETMTVPWEKIRYGKVGKEIYTSKFNGEQYKLISYKWEPEQRRLI